MRLSHARGGNGRDGPTRLQATGDLFGNSGLIQWYDAQLRQIQIDPCVAGSAYSAINALTNKHESKTQEHTAEEANRGIHRQAWTVRECWRFGAVHHHNAAVAHGAR